jgi:large subunit ribosomal protein L24
MKVKVNDTVKVLAGKDKGKEGKVIRTLKKENKVVVEGINIVKKHSKPTNTNDKGGIFDIEAPIHVSNVKVIDAKKAPVKKTAKNETKKEEVKEVEEKKTVKKTTTTKKSTTSKKASK